MLDHWDEVCSCYEADDTYIRSYLRERSRMRKKAAVVDVGDGPATMCFRLSILWRRHTDGLSDPLSAGSGKKCQ